CSFVSVLLLFDSTSSSCSSVLAAPRGLHSFPTRRSSDLVSPFQTPDSEDAFLTVFNAAGSDITYSSCIGNTVGVVTLSDDEASSDRKSTRLNSSHQIISYAVFCLKKKSSPI